MANSLVLLPTFNELDNLARMLGQLVANPNVDILVIDDDSPDGTGVIADKWAQNHSAVSVLHRTSNPGLGRAYIEGFKYAIDHGYQKVITMDADLSHDPKLIDLHLNQLENHSVSVGSRLCEGGRVEGWPLWRKLLSRMGSLYSRTLLGLSVKDVTSGYRGYRVDHLAKLSLSSVKATGFFFQIEILSKLLKVPGATAIEIPIVFKDRELGSSKMSWRIFIEALGRVLQLAIELRFHKKADTNQNRRIKSSSGHVVETS